MSDGTVVGVSGFMNGSRAGEDVCAMWSDTFARLVMVSLLLQPLHSNVYKA